MRCLLMAVAIGLAGLAAMADDVDDAIEAQKIAAANQQIREHNEKARERNHLTRNVAIGCFAVAGAVVILYSVIRGGVADGQRDAKGS